MSNLVCTFVETVIHIEGVVLTVFWISNCPKKNRKRVEFLEIFGHKKR